MEYPLQLTFKVFALAPQLTIRDAKQAPVLYVRQKLMKFKEEVAVYLDDSKTDHLFNINADRVIDFSARYRFKHNESSQSLGSIKRHGFRSMWKVYYEIFAEDENTPLLTIREESAWTVFFDGLFSEIPIIGALSGYVFNPKFNVLDSEGKSLVRVTKKPSFFETKFTIEKLDETLTGEAEWRILLSILMMSLLERSRG